MFILAVELLLIKINNTKLIEGITYAQKESQREPFVEEDTSKCLDFLKHFARTSGLQCNLEKTAVIPIGVNYDINDKLCLELALS